MLGHIAQFAALVSVLAGIAYGAYRFERSRHPAEADPGTVTISSTGLAKISPIDAARQAVARGELNEAITTLSFLIKADPFRAEALSLRGETYLRQGNSAAAAADLRTALDLEPNAPTNRWLYAVALLAQGMTNEATRSLDQTLVHHPAFTPALLERAKLFEAQAKTTEALATYSAALAADRENVTALIGQTSMLFQLGRAADALVDLDRLTATVPENAQIRFLRAGGLAAVGRLPEAISEADECIRLVPGASKAWLLKGQILSALGRHPDALQAFDEALRLQPDLAPALEARNRIAASQDPSASAKPQ